MPDRLSSLEDVYTFSGSDTALPTMEVTSRRPRPVHLLAREAIRQTSSEEQQRRADTVWREFSLLVSSLRRDASPSSVLHSLIMEDGQTIGSIAASVDRDVEDIEASLLALQAEGWVQLRTEGTVERVRLLLVGPETD